VWRDGEKLATTANTSYLDKSTSNGLTYSYTVVARDSVGNESGPGNAVSVTIGGGTSGGGGPSENCKNGVDDDNDGLVDCADSDCRKNRVCR